MKEEKTILIVDDEEINVTLLKAILIAENYNLSSALNGEAALRIAADIHPDLILLDVMMPGIDGFEVCKRIKADETTKIIPIVMVTALNEKEDRIKAMKAGADDFLNKPVDQNELLLRVKSLIRIKSYHDELLDSYMEIMEKNNKLSELERAKESLTHMIIHDLNNPICAISIGLEVVLAQKGTFSEKQAHRLNQCLNSCRDLEDLVQSILDINRMEEGKLKPAKKLTNFVDLTNDALEQFIDRIESEGSSLSVTTEEGLALVSLDPNLIKRVLGNLINNAICHIPAGGRIEIKINHSPQEESICFSIRDNGDGLAPDYHQKIFDKFRQVEIKETGAIKGRSGLGLAFCKMAVESHKGKIWVESEGEGKGSTFSFTIPLSSGAK